MDLPTLRVSPGRDSPARLVCWPTAIVATAIVATASAYSHHVLAYGQRVDVGTERTIGRSRLKRNVPASCYAAHRIASGGMTVCKS